MCLLGDDFDSGAFTVHHRRVSAIEWVTLTLSTVALIVSGASAFFTRSQAAEAKRATDLQHATLSSELRVELRWSSRERMDHFMRPGRGASASTGLVLANGPDPQYAKMRMGDLDLINLGPSPAFHVVVSTHGRPHLIAPDDERIVYRTDRLTFTLDRIDPGSTAKVILPFVMPSPPNDLLISITWRDLMGLEHEMTLTPLDAISRGNLSRG